MESAFPFFNNDADNAGSAIYHTHPRCRVAQQVPLEARVMGTGERRCECPFCFLLAQFQANRALRGHSSHGIQPFGTSSANAGAQPLRTLRLQG